MVPTLNRLSVRLVPNTLTLESGPGMALFAKHESRMRSRKDHLTARHVADDVGCYVQKVAKFGEKLERAGIIVRERVEELRKNIYFGPDAPSRE